MARPKIYDEQLRSRLLELTAEVIRTQGPAGLSLRQLAGSAGTSTSAVYALFGSKDELLDALTAHAFASFGAKQQEALPRGLRALGLTYRQWALEHSALYSLMFAQPLTQLSEATLQIAQDSLASLVAAVSQRQAEDPLNAAVLIWAQVHGALSLELAQAGPPETSWQQIYERLLDQIEASLPQDQQHGREQDA